MKRIAVFLVVLVGGAAFADAQGRRVTNADLEKFKVKRLAAEQDLRENYARLGFPSPEEMEKQRDQEAKERMELFESLQAARLERERLEIERQRLAVEQAKAEQPIIVVEGRDDNGYFFGYSTFGGGFGNRFPWRSRFPFRGRFFGNDSYRVGGGLVIYDSGYSSGTRIGSGVQQRPLPIWRPVRPR